jgi:hypothetical protein
MSKILINAYHYYQNQLNFFIHNNLKTKKKKLLKKLHNKLKIFRPKFL